MDCNGHFKLKKAALWITRTNFTFCPVSIVKRHWLLLLTLKVYNAIYLVDEAIHASFSDHLGSNFLSLETNKTYIMENKELHKRHLWRKKGCLIQADFSGDLTNFFPELNRKIIFTIIQFLIKEG